MYVSETLSDICGRYICDPVTAANRFQDFPWLYETIIPNAITAMMQQLIKTARTLKAEWGQVLEEVDGGSTDA